MKEGGSGDTEGMWAVPRHRYEDHRSKQHLIYNGTSPAKRRATANGTAAL